MYNLKFISVLVLGLISVLIFSILRARKGGISGLISKTIASFFFVLTGLSASLMSTDNSDIKYMLIVGLLLGMLGDISLDLKIVYKKDFKIWLYSGFISFMLGHIFYIIALLSASRMTPIFILISIMAGIIMAALAMSLEKLLKLNYGPYKKIAFIYAAVLSSTLTLSLTASLSTAFKNPQLSIFFIGSIFFIISDFILSNTYFGIKPKEGHIWIIANHATYYMAQYLIASSILFL